ncbi:MAG: DNA (cytosine-5-)-methyltransferase [Azoarcus sp.]|jgi:DNA (cytosine-5)-methyltransferase 1|nr:DNA (cytosine-5-)-methyltransferase [Azoarcus sp.]
MQIVAAISSKKIKFVDIFAGIGGIRLGFETALHQHGFNTECVFSCEIHPRAQETYALNFNETPHDDIRTVEELPPHDIMLAGFPCQAFSYAGKQKGFADTRGTLFFEIERLLAKCTHKPKYVLLENVRGFTTHDKGRTFKTVIERLNALGYEIEPLLLNSALFGVPQNRVRLYLVCKLNEKPMVSIQSDVGYADSHKFKGLCKQEDFFTCQKRKPVVGDILETNVSKKYYCSEKFVGQIKKVLNEKPLSALNGVRLIDHRGGNSIHSWELGTKGDCSEDEQAFMNALIANRRKKHFGTHQDGKKLTREQIATFWEKDNLNGLISSLLKKGYLSEDNGKYNPVAGNMSFEVFKFLDLNSIAITLVSTDANRLGVVDKNNIPRRITPRECARLQGFPDSFVLHHDDEWAYHQLGNSVSVPVVAAIFSDIIKRNQDFHAMALESTPLSLTLCNASPAFHAEIENKIKRHGT